MNFTIKGMKELDKALKKIPAGSETAVKKSLTDIALDLQGESQRRAPVDTGDLRGSAYTKQDGLTAEVGFSSPYAVRQHENMQYKHKRGGEAKYLENPFKERRDRYLKDIGDAVKKAVT